MSWLDKYSDDVSKAQKGKKVKKPIVVDNPNDPRLHKYLDSLNLYKGYELSKKYNKIDPSMDPLVAKKTRPKGEVKYSKTTVDPHKSYDDYLTYIKEYQKKFDEVYSKKGMEGIEKDPFFNTKKSKTIAFSKKADLAKYDKDAALLVDQYETLHFKEPVETGYWSTPDLYHPTIQETGSYLKGAWNPIFAKPKQEIQYSGDFNDVLQLRNKPYIAGVTSPKINYPPALQPKVQAIDIQPIESNISIPQQQLDLRMPVKMPKSYNVSSQRSNMTGPNSFYDYQAKEVDYETALKAKKAADAYNKYIEEKYGNEEALKNPKAKKRLEQLRQEINITPNFKNGGQSNMDGLTDEGFDYNGAWGGQFQMGGNIYPVNYVPQAQMGASLPGASGMMYAREGAPSNEKYAKKTLPSAQEGRTITIDEGEGNKRNILTDSSEYETLYNEGRIGIKNEDDSISMNPLNEVVVTNVDKEYPFYQNLSDEEKKYFNSDSPIGRQIRSKAKDNVGFNADKATEFAMGWLRDLPLSGIQAPQSALVEGVEAVRGNEFNMLNAIEPDKQRIPSETWGIENPYAAFAVDTFTDPETLIGMSFLKNPLQKGLQQTGKYLTTKTPLQNTHKLNPWAFKPNPESYYRGIGKEGVDDILESGIIRSKKQHAYPEPYFSKGVVGDKYAKGYFVELTNEPMKGVGSFRTGDLIQTPVNTVSINNPNLILYKKDWLRGYKPIEIPNVDKSFKSEIDWRNWVKYKEDFDNNPDVINELLNIERNAKANGTWMKNPDGTPFQGTPEQFVIENSENFKKAFPDYYGSKLHHRSKNEFNAFDENKFGSTDGGYHGKGIYTSEDAFRTARYGDKPYELYVNTRNKGVNPDYNEFYRKDLNESLNALEKVYLQQKSLPKDFPEFYPNIEKYNKDLDIKFEKDIRGLIQNKKQLDNYDLIKVGNEVVIPFDNPVKSAIGNILFDMTNPNMHKAMLPVGLGLGAASQMQGEAPQYKKGGVIKDDRGQWEHPGKITEINSPYITMKGVPYPVLGISDTGDVQMMYPEEEYKFDGNKVTEYPLAKDGKELVKLNQLTNFTNYNTKQPGGWLDKY